MIKTLITYLTIFLSFIALWGVGNLSLKEWHTANGCPKIAGIPVCYIITILVFLLLYNLIFQSSQKVLFFYIGAGIPWLIAIIASIGHWKGLIRCPISEGGIPMCYLSFVLFSSIILLWVVSRKFIL